MSTLVTGATGGFGCILAAWLQGQPGESVVLTSRGAHQGDDILPCDLTDREALRALVHRVRPRLVYHLAGSLANEYETDYAVNALSGRHILDALLEEKLDSRVVFIGSAAEYGVISPEENPVSEDRALHPVSVYGLTKAFQTQIAGVYAYQHGSNVVVARMFNVLARGLSERLFVGRVERLIARYCRGEIQAIEVGNLDNHRDYVAAEEAIVQIELIAAHGERGRAYHVASGQPTAVRDVLHRLLDAAGVPVSAVKEGANATGGRGRYDAPVIYANMGRTRALASRLESRME
jgi:nucleoside-diphosphate-sugar epimerase